MDIFLSFFSFFSFFLPKRWLHSGALPCNSSRPPLFIFVGWGGGNMTGHHCQLLKPLLPSPPQPPLALLKMGFHWHPSGPRPWSPDFHVEDLRMDSGLGMNKPAAGWKDARGWGGKAFLRFHLTWKLGCWVGTVPEQSQSRGRITFIQLLSVFPRQNSHQRCQMHSDFPPCTLGIASKRRDRAPCLYARRDPRKSKNWSYLLGV